MAASGLATDPENIDELYLDAEMYIMATHCGPLWSSVRSNNKERMKLLESLLRKLREDPMTVKIAMGQLYG